MAGALLSAVLLALVPAQAADEADGLHALAAVPPAGLDHAPETCARCHRRVARQWSSSGHAAAFTSPRFQAAWAPRAQGWCIHCHAPLESQQDGLNDGIVVDPAARLRAPADPAQSTAADGVSCAACHLREGTVRTPDRPSLWARLAHPAEQDPALTDGTRCAGCHEFAFPLHSPVWPFATGTTPLQATASEWAESAAAAEGTGCVDCHFPRGRHHLPGATTPGMVEDAVAVDFLVGCRSVQATLTATGAAHAVPTGDPFRALELRLCASDCAVEDAVATARFGQSFTPDATTWQRTADTRIPPATEGRSAATTATLTVDQPPSAWALTLRLADRAHAHLPPEEQGRVVARGRLAPPETPCPSP